MVRPLASFCTMATTPPSPRANKRVKLYSAAKETITSLDNPAFNQSDVTESKTHTKMTFRCPVTINNVFNAPTPSYVKMFYESRSSSTRPFDRLPEGKKLAWTESSHDNKTLMGFIVYSQLFPKLLQNRIKLNAATYHWAHLDTSEKGRAKLEQRRHAAKRLKRTGFMASVFMGLPYKVDTSGTSDILAYMNMDFDEEDERFRFFTKREFSMIFSQRGQVGSSSVYASCSMALSLLWFATAVLSRPCCLESIILPLSVKERQTMEQRFGCPARFFDGAVRSFQTNWKDVFTTIDTQHRNINYTMLEKACEHKYVEGVHVADVYAVFRATMTAPGDVNSIATLVQSYKTHAKHGVESGAVVGVIDVIREKPVEAIGKIDGGVLGAIFSTYGEQACLKVQDQCNRLSGGSSLFDDTVSNKLSEILAHFDCELWKARKKDKVERVVVSNMDPTGMNKKIEGGRMLDPTNPKSIELMHAMLRSISRQVWKPLKNLVGEKLGASIEHPTAFLRITHEEAELLYKHALDSGVTYNDIANLCTLLILSFSFQRSQVLRESTIDEFVLVPDATHYKFSFKNRRFKTASSGGSSSAPPVSHFELTADQSMIARFIFTVGHMFCKVPRFGDEKRRLFVNTRGQSWTQQDVASRFKRIGVQWLGIENFGPHVCRTFWSTYALNSGQISGANLEDFSSFLQVSSNTLRNSYMSAGANTAAHAVGNAVLGAVVNAACTVEETQKGDRPNGKKLSSRRLAFKQDIQASLATYGGNGRRLFRDLLQKRDVSQLNDGDKWFRWENTFFSQSDERVFLRFLGKVGV